MWIEITTVVAAVGCGLMAGTFFTFSSFVMRSLEDQPLASRIATMQAINRRVYNVSFLGTFLGTNLLCLALVAEAATHWGAPGTGLRLAGGLCYVVGCFGVTAGLNVPLNKELEDVDPTSDDAEAAWAAYGPPWTGWNSFRATACVLALVAMLWSLIG